MMGPGAGVRRGLAAVLLVLAGWSAAPAAERYGWLGVRIRDLSEAEMDDFATKFGIREGYGVMIEEILPDTPAQAAGLRARDLVVAIDDRPVVETRVLQRLIGAAPTGREVRLMVLRDGRRRELRVRVGEMPPDVVAERIAVEFGFLVRDMGEEAGPARRPVVAVVVERSAAARGGLLVGDRVLALNGVQVDSLDAFRRVFGGVSVRDPLSLSVERQGEARSLVLPPAQPPLPRQ
jgi:serine protease Do